MMHLHLRSPSTLWEESSHGTRLRFGAVQPKMLRITFAMIVLLCFSVQSSVSRALILDLQNPGSDNKQLKPYMISVRQRIQNQWSQNPPSSPVKADISFRIEADGTVSEVQMKSRSGEIAAALSATKAITFCAPFPAPPLKDQQFLNIVASFDSYDLDSLYPAGSNRMPPVAPSRGAPTRVKPASRRFLDLQAARDYALQLINEDRKKEGLKPVSLDEIANQAGQWHSDEMAKFQFGGHWSPDGLTPPRRYSLCNGFDYCMENARGSNPPGTGGWSGVVAQFQNFTREEIEQAQSAYMHSEGHRRNIMMPEHTHVGLGFTLMDTVHQTGSRNRQITCAQEFVNKYGQFRESGTELRTQTEYKLEGVIDPPFKIQSVLVQRENFPKPIPLKVLRTDSRYTGAYSFPAETIVTVFPSARTKSVSLLTDEDAFSIRLTPGEEWEEGMYYVTIFAADPSEKTIPVSLKVLPLKRN